VVCPWCYIGKRRFEAALAQFAHRDAVAVLWRSFELDPHAERKFPGTLDELLARKMGGGIKRAAVANARVTALAAEVGLEYHLDRAQPGNTFDAHRLLHLAAAHGLQGAMQERLMRAYFTEGLPVGDAGTLLGLSAEVGLDAEEARAILEGDAYTDEVRADEELAGAYGISGVPFFVLGEHYGVSGAQPAEVFSQALAAAWAASQPLTLVGGGDAKEADACGDDSCAI
jgi:predicted DsbA family dithiol-disulfide isomerase